MKYKHRLYGFIVEATQWNASMDALENLRQLIREMRQSLTYSNNLAALTQLIQINNDLTISLQTHDGLKIVNIGDYIVKFLCDEFECSNPAVFEELYEEIIIEKQQ